MGLNDINTVDAAGVERSTGDLVLSILDSWTWDNEQGHLLALQAKLNAYFDFIEGDQLYETYPDGRGRQVVIEVVWRFAPVAGAVELLAKAEAVGAELGVRIRSRVQPK